MPILRWRALVEAVAADNTAAAVRNRRVLRAAEQKEAARREVPGEANTVVRSRSLG